MFPGEKMDVVYKTFWNGFTHYSYFDRGGSELGNHWFGRGELMVISIFIQTLFPINKSFYTTSPHQFPLEYDKTLLELPKAELTEDNFIDFEPKDFKLKIDVDQTEGVETVKVKEDQEFEQKEGETNPQLHVFIPEETSALKVETQGTLFGHNDNDTKLLVHDK